MAKQRSRHPNKEIEAAVQYAEANGWTCTVPGGHAWGILWCTHGRRGGCRFGVWSTPRSPDNHCAIHPAEGGSLPALTVGVEMAKKEHEFTLILSGVKELTRECSTPSTRRAVTTP